MLLQTHDLLAIEVKDPATLPRRLEADAAAALIPIEPIPLQSSVKIANYLERDMWLTVVHFPCENDKEISRRAKCLEVSVGLRRIVDVCQGKSILQLLHK